MSTVFKLRVAASLAIFWVAALVLHPLGADAGACPANAVPATGTVLNGTSGVISLWPYTNNNLCQWTVQCPPSTVFRVQNLTLYTETNYDYLTIGACGSGTRRYTGGIDALGIATNTSSVALSFYSDYSNVVLGFVLTYECMQVTGCTSSVGLFSDMLNCSQPLSCPALAVSAPTYYEVERLEVCGPAASGSGSSSGSAASLPPSSVQFGYRTVTSAAPLPQPLLLPSTTTAVVDTVYFSAPPGLNATFLLDYDCGIGAVCDSVNTSRTITASEGVIISDTDGVGPTLINPSDSCAWTVTCPSSTDVVAVVARMGAGTSTQLAFYSTTTGQLQRVLSGTTSTTLLINASSFQLTFTAVLAATIYATISPQPGFTVQYACRSALCTSINATGSVYSGLASGTIMSDVDGAGPITYAEYEACAWTVNCAAGTAFFINSLQFSTRTLVDWLNISDASSGLQLAWFSGKPTAASPTNFVMQSSAVVVRFSAGHSTTAPLQGFTLRFQCIPKTCEAVQGSSSMQNCSLTLPTPSCPVGRRFVGEALDWPGAGTQPEATGVSLEIAFNGSSAISYTPSGSTILQNTVGLSTVLTANIVLPATGAIGVFFGYVPCAYFCNSTAPSGSLFTQPMGNVATLPGQMGQLCSWMVSCANGRTVELSSYINQEDYWYDLFVISDMRSGWVMSYRDYSLSNWYVNTGLSNVTVAWSQ